MPPLDMAEKASEVSGLLKLLANPNRLMIACRLLEGEISVGDIELELGIKQPTLSRELGRLRDDGIIQARRQSKVVFYTLAHPQMALLIKAVCAASSLEEKNLQPNPAARPVRPGFFPRPKFANASHHKVSGYSKFASIKYEQGPAPRTESL